MSIVLDQLTKLYAGRRVVDRVSLEIGDSELFVLLGSSGSGKSTVLRLIAGLSREDGGTINLFGRDVTGLPAQERGVGFVFQNYSIFRHMTVSKNIEFGLRLRKVPHAERRRKSDELLELIELGGLGDRYAHQLSGGQQQRVALARALAYQPRVLLLDEPFGALDAKIRTQLRRTLREIQRALSVTTILVTHDQEEAFELGDRIGVIDRGRLLEVGTGEALYSRPQSFFVATFLGAGTVLVGRCEEGRARFGSVTLPIPPELPHEEGGPVRLLVRPEQVALGEETSAGAPSFGKATVAEQTFAGGLRRVRVRLPEGGFRQIFPIAPYGEEGILIDAVVAADRELAPEVEVSLKRWRVLAQPEPRVLVADAGLRSTEALAAAVRVGRAIGGALTVLGVARDSDEIEKVRASLVERMAAADAGQIEIRVRAGDRGEQIATELAESFYDLYVADGGGDGEKRRGSLLDEPVLAARTRTPVLFVRGTPRPLRNLLVCTAVGEPGRQAVRLGGWLAARLRARALLLHVLRGAEEPPEWVRAHLERGVRTLHALGVQGEFRVRRARSPLEGILAEVREGEHDLVVIGSHGPRLRSVLGRDDVTNQVLTASDRPVLVIPAEQ